MAFALQSLADINADQWNALWQSDYPFVQHAYLLALERSQCTHTHTGWQPAHATLHENGRLVAVLIGYIKAHSYGEYVFDWAWANAYDNAGLHYYPKWISAIPFTPCTGPRLAATTAASAESLLIKLGESLTPFSNHHILFPSTDTARHLDSGTYFQRLGCQFHWFNQNFATFEAFVGSFASRKRKNVLKERNKVHTQGVTLQQTLGIDLNTEDWAFFHTLYAQTYLKRSGHAGYLNADFFQQVGRCMANQIMMVKAFHEGRWVAAALYFYDHHTLYGRYWGTLYELDSLHYECCYYQGIEFAIANGLQHFDAGAQGEHKIQRGFTPVLTQSFHHLQDSRFHRAIQQAIAVENQHTQDYCRDARTYLPFKSDHPIPTDNGLILST